MRRPQLAVQSDSLGPSECVDFPSCGRERTPPFTGIVLGFGLVLYNGSHGVFWDLSPAPPCGELGGARHAGAQTAA